MSFSAYNVDQPAAAAAKWTNLDHVKYWLTLNDMHLSKELTIFYVYHKKITLADGMNSDEDRQYETINSVKKSNGKTILRIHVEDSMGWNLI